ncbi:hypothetical protein BBJ28_00026783 [Nothophytophthora sp. Chile5]|nr:hypothetical protein BBJ28_00026783 [Nothophytophthora sp. Chile5]
MELEVPLPELLTCRLYIKNGLPLTSCHEKVSPSPSFLFRVADVYRVLKAKVEEHFESKLPGKWTSELDIYLKPSNNAPQKDFEALCPASDGLLTQLNTTWHKARLRRNGQAGFVLMLSVYVPKPTEQVTTLRRASAARVQEQVPRVAALLREQGLPTGGASERYMAVTQARLPGDASIVVPDSTTFRQLQHIDTQQAAMDEEMAGDQQLASLECCLIRIKIQDVPVPIQVNVRDLRAALGLPGYSLRPPFRAPTTINTPGPEEDMEDVDHADEMEQMANV